MGIYKQGTYTVLLMVTFNCTSICTPDYTGVRNCDCDHMHISIFPIAIQKIIKCLKTPKTESDLTMHAEATSVPSGLQSTQNTSYE